LTGFNPKDKAWKSRLQHNYGLSSSEYNTFLKKQEGKCAICKKTLEEGKRLSVDHSHHSGRVRGLLCSNCNIGIGHFFDKPELLLSAYDYIKKHYEIDKDYYPEEILKRIKEYENKKSSWFGF
jgi:hypothetical protein